MTRIKNLHPLPGSGGRVNRSIGLPAWFVVSAAVGAVLAILFIAVRVTTVDSYSPLYVGGARARISQTSFDYGDVKNNTLVKTIFTIQNVGDKQLYFAQEPVVQAVEGCCPPQAEIDRSELNPGEVAQVSMSFSMHEGMDGPHDFRVKVRSSDVEEPEQEVVILSNWIP